MKWFALLLGILLAVATGTVIEQEARYVEMRAYAARLYIHNQQAMAAYAKCVRNSWKST